MTPRLGPKPPERFSGNRRWEVDACSRPGTSRPAAATSPGLALGMREAEKRTSSGSRLRTQFGTQVGAMFDNIGLRQHSPTGTDPTAPPDRAAVTPSRAVYRDRLI